jgi:acetyltransferase-like isoleucine patch superfamily enzyme
MSLCERGSKRHELIEGRKILRAQKIFRPVTAHKQRSLNQLGWLRRALVRVKLIYYTYGWGMDIDPTASFSLSARFDMTYPRGVHVGARSYIAFEAAILSHDMTRGLYLHTRIGKHCFIGARSIILSGIQVGDESIVAAGSVVTKDVPSRCVVAGNPAQIIRRDISVGPYGRFTDAEETKLRLAAAGAFD